MEYYYIAIPIALVVALIYSAVKSQQVYAATSDRDRARKSFAWRLALSGALFSVIAAFGPVLASLAMIAWLAATLRPIAPYRHY